MNVSLRTISCEEAREVILELAYPEGKTAVTPEFKRHFSACSACSNSYLELLETRQLMGLWEDEEPPARMRLLPAPAMRKHPGWFSGWLAWRPLPALVASLALLIGVLVLAGLSIRWDQGGVQIQTGLFQSSPQPAGERLASESSREMVAAVDRMLSDSEARQNRQTLQLMQRMAESLEYRRQMDLLQVRDEVGLLHQNYNQALEKNSLLLEQAAKVMRQNRY